MTKRHSLRLGSRENRLRLGGANSSVLPSLNLFETVGCKNGDRFVWHMGHKVLLNGFELRASDHGRANLATGEPGWCSTAFVSSHGPAGAVDVLE